MIFFYLFFYVKYIKNHNFFILPLLLQMWWWKLKLYLSMLHCWLQVTNIVTREIQFFFLHLQMRVIWFLFNIFNVTNGYRFHFPNLFHQFVENQIYYMIATNFFRQIILQIITPISCRTRIKLFLFFLLSISFSFIFLLFSSWFASLSSLDLEPPLSLWRLIEFLLGF